jgi:hypothetical protein
MTSKIRFFHSCSQLGKCDFYFKDHILCPDLSYLGHSHYHQIDHGKIVIRLCPPKKHYSILDAYTYVAENSFHTAVVTGLNGNLSLFVVPDAYIPLTQNKAFIRFVNLAPDKNLDFIVYDGSAVTINNVSYREATDYYMLKSDTYNIAARISGTNNIFLTIKDAFLAENRFYTIYVFGHVRNSNLPGYLIFPDGID